MVRLAVQDEYGMEFTKNYNFITVSTLRDVDSVILADCWNLSGKSSGELKIHKLQNSKFVHT